MKLVTFHVNAHKRVEEVVEVDEEETYSATIAILLVTLRGTVQMDRDNVPNDKFYSTRIQMSNDEVLHLIIWWSVTGGIYCYRSEHLGLLKMNFGLIWQNYKIKTFILELNDLLNYEMYGSFELDVTRA